MKSFLESDLKAEDWLDEKRQRIKKQKRYTELAYKRYAKEISDEELHNKLLSENIYLSKLYEMAITDCIISLIIGSKSGTQSVPNQEIKSFISSYGGKYLEQLEDKEATKKEFTFKNYILDVLKWKNPKNKYEKLPNDDKKSFWHFVDAVDKELL